MLMQEDYDADEILRDDFEADDLNADDVDELNFEGKVSGGLDDLADDIEDPTELLE